MINNEINDNTTSATLRQGKLFNQSKNKSNQKHEQEGFTMPDISSLGARDSRDSSDLNPLRYTDHTGKTTKYNSTFNNDFISRFGESTNPFSQSGTLPSQNSWEQSKALQDTNKLLHTSGNLIKNEIEQLNELEDRYNATLSEYNQSKEDLMGVVDEYADKVVSDPNINRIIISGNNQYFFLYFKKVKNSLKKFIKIDCPLTVIYLFYLSNNFLIYYFFSS